MIVLSSLGTVTVRLSVATVAVLLSASAVTVRDAGVGGIVAASLAVNERTRPGAPNGWSPVTCDPLKAIGYAATVTALWAISRN